MNLDNFLEVIKKKENFDILNKEFTEKHKDGFALANYYYQQNYGDDGETEFKGFKDLEVVTATEVYKGFTFALRLKANFDYGKANTQHNFTYAIACNVDKSLNNFIILEMKMKP